MNRILSTGGGPESPDQRPLDGAGALYIAGARSLTVAMSGPVPRIRIERSKDVSIVGNDANLTQSLQTVNVLGTEIVAIRAQVLGLLALLVQKCKY